MLGLAFARRPDIATTVLVKWQVVGAHIGFELSRVDAEICGQVFVAQHRDLGTAPGALSM